MDPEFIVIYGKNGFVAGMQSLVSKKFNLSNYDFENSGWYKEDNIFEDGVFISTVYFMDPNKICKISGRNETADNRKLLWLDRSDGYVRVPPTRNLAEANVSRFIFSKEVFCLVCGIMPKISCSFWASV